MRGDGNENHNNSTCFQPRSATQRNHHGSGVIRQHSGEPGKAGCGRYSGGKGRKYSRQNANRKSQVCARRVIVLATGAGGDRYNNGIARLVGSHAAVGMKRRRKAGNRQQQRRVRENKSEAGWALASWWGGRTCQPRIISTAHTYPRRTRSIPTTAARGWEQYSRQYQVHRQVMQKVRKAKNTEYTMNRRCPYCNAR